jgi:hypothetical protein
MSLKRPDLRFTAAVALLFVLFSCVQPPLPRVGLKKLAADVVFGAARPQPVVAPAGAVQDEPIEGGTTNFKPLRSSSAPSPVINRCPNAGANEFPSQEAPLTVTDRPKGGYYAWKQKGSEKRPEYPIRIPMPEFADRQVKEVNSSGLPATDFTFRTVEKDPSLLSNTLITSTFRVDLTNPDAGSRGIVLTKVERDRQDGSKPGEFNPNPAVMYLPLPVRIGSEFAFDSVGVDPITLQTMRQQGYVRERKRIDACGKLIDSWLVDGQRTIISSGGSNPSNYDYAIATHLGGLIVFEHVESPCQPGADGKCPTEAQLAYDTNIGQLTPDPAPKKR